MNSMAAEDRRQKMMKTRAYRIALATCALAGLTATIAAAEEREPLKPIGQAQGIHPGRVVWVHDPDVINWKGPEDGHWWENNRLKQERVDAMMARAVCELTGESSVAKAWDRLFRHLNQKRGKGDAGYKPGEKIMIKPNWVSMIFHEGHVDLEKGTFIRRHDYMNTSPQMIIALLKHLSSERGVTVISATHDYKMLNVSDRVVWIRDGRIDKIEERSELDITVGGIGAREA